MKAILKTSLLASMVLLSSCIERDEDPIETLPDPDPIVETPTSCNVIEINDNITTPTTWKAGNTYVIKNKNITVRQTSLTIEPGVVVKLKDARLDVVGGSIIANGSADKRITFTSLADDSLCGDSNGDKNATQAQKGDWRGIHLNGGSGYIFRNVDFLYAGQNSGGFNNAVKITSSVSSFEFDGCNFAHTLFSSSASYDNSTAFYAGSFMTDPSQHRFVNNSFYDNGKPIYIYAMYTLDPSNKFHNPKNTSEKNTHNGIYMTYSGGGLDSSVNWRHTEVPYVLDENMQATSSQRVTVGENVAVKFKRSGAGISFKTANFSYHSSAIFTSYQDDAVKGDTNGNGTQSTPKKGDWRGLYEQSAQLYHNGANIRYNEK